MLHANDLEIAFLKNLSEKTRSLRIVLQKFCGQGLIRDASFQLSSLNTFSGLASAFQFLHHPSAADQSPEKRFGCRPPARPSLFAGIN
jgi:hypothetical protein